MPFCTKNDHYQARLGTNIGKTLKKRSAFSYSALLAATGSSTYKTSQEMGYRCCGMTDYFMQTGNTFSHVPTPANIGVTS